ncbi:site-2 protease family protein [Pseudogracilibacillus sp. ICA-222130]|uniref:site-2 protease family protein n=1 Tax=Pseudogracilibacillus sp. ICA-222130 TaxID=3134655 RepID=UPI0030BDEA67
MIYVLYFIFLIFFVAPFSLLIHELGHMFGAVRMKATKIQLSIGTGKKLYEKDEAQFHIIIRRLFLFHYATATVRDQPFTSKEKVVITLMGPVFNGIVAFIFFIIDLFFYEHLGIQLCMLFNFWLFFVNLIPFKIGQKQSDGYTIYRLFF